MTQNPAIEKSDKPNKTKRFPRNTVINPQPLSATQPLIHEHEKAYEAFLTYRDMDHGRSHTAVAAKIGKSRQMVSKWAAKFQWNERMRRWHGENQLILNKAVTARVQEMVERQLGLATAIELKVAERLVTLDPADLTPSDMVKMLTIAVQIERTAMGMGGKLNLEKVDAVEMKRPEGDVVSDAARSLTPVDRDLLRTLSLKFMKIVKGQAELRQDIEVKLLEAEAHEASGRAEK
jgi:low affinity Fe/Cu permease